MALDALLLRDISHDSVPKQCTTSTSEASNAPVFWADAHITLLLFTSKMFTSSHTQQHTST